MKFVFILGLILVGSNSFASGRYGVKCQSENFEMKFTTFGVAETEMFSRIYFRDKVEISR